MVVECKEVEYRKEDLKKHHKVKRFATEGEVAAWRHHLVGDEAKAMRFIRTQVENHNIPVVVHRAEFQFDRKKLTFHYTTDHPHPDFRALLREGYRQFRCRIWMNNCRPKGNEPGEYIHFE